MSNRRLIATDLSMDCVRCSLIIEPGERYTNLSDGPSHIACFGQMLPAEAERPTPAWAGRPRHRTKTHAKGPCS